MKLLFNISIYTWCICSGNYNTTCRVKENCTAKVTKGESKKNVNVGLLKHNFWVMAAWILKKMPEVFTLSFNAGCCTPEQWFEVIYLLLSNTSDLLIQHSMLHVSVIVNYLQALKYVI